MTQKFTYQGYTICITFRSDNALSITASFNLTGQHFINDMVQLGKIKKDTVLATLAKKSPKNLWCQFKMVDAVPRKLIISFVVNFDYLPQFSEDIVLEQMQIKGSVLNKISSVQLQSDIDQIQKVINSIKKNGSVQLQEKQSSVNKNTTITQFQVNQGVYLLQISGIMLNAASLHDSVEFLIKQQNSNDEIKLKQKSHSQHGYAYPYSISHKIDAREGKIEIYASNSGTGNLSLQNQIITLIPVLGRS